MIRWDPSIGLAGIITALSFVAAAIGLWFTGHQIRQSTKMRRGQFLLDATERYFSDTEVRKLYYDIDYGEFSIEFNAAGEPSTFTRHQSAPQRFIGSAEERHLDSLLYTLDCIGRIVEIGVFDRREAQLFAFQANRVFHNSHVAEILRWLDKERERFGGEVPTHSAGRALAGQAPARSA